MKGSTRTTAHAAYAPSSPRLQLQAAEVDDTSGTGTERASADGRVHPAPWHLAAGAREARSSRRGRPGKQAKQTVSTAQRPRPHAQMTKRGGAVSVRGWIGWLRVHRAARRSRRSPKLSSRSAGESWRTRQRGVVDWVSIGWSNFRTAWSGLHDAQPAAGPGNSPVTWTVRAWPACLKRAAASVDAKKKKKVLA